MIKICGVRRRDHALTAVDAGADMLGLVFAPSRRQITVEDAASIADAARVAASDHGRAIALIGVFVNETVERIRDVAQSCGLDGVQLSGDEPIAYADALESLLIIKAIRSMTRRTSMRGCNTTGLMYACWSMLTCRAATAALASWLTGFAPPNWRVSVPYFWQVD